MKKFLWAVLPAILLGCYPQGPEYYEDLDVVITKFDKDFNFASKTTFTIPNRVVRIDGSVADGNGPSFVPDGPSSAIIARIKTNMENYGWVYVPEANIVDDNDDGVPDNVDVTILPATWQNTTIYYWYDYWCGWYYYCGWGWYYPTVSAYTTGTLVMFMVTNDVANYPSADRVWVGAVNGLLSGAYNINRVNTGIDQAFEQSPYLKTN